MSRNGANSMPVRRPANRVMKDCPAAWLGLTPRFPVEVRLEGSTAACAVAPPSMEDTTKTRKEKLSQDIEDCARSRTLANGAGRICLIWSRSLMAPSSGPLLQLEQHRGRLREWAKNDANEDEDTRGSASR